MKNKQSFLILFLLITLIFFAGFFVGGVLNNPGRSIEKILKQSELNAESFAVEQALFEEFEATCELSEKRLSVLSKDLWDLGKLLGSPTAKKDLGDTNYNFLKRKFHLMQIKTYTLYKKLKENCGSTTNIILFYFSQTDKLSENQGKILDKLVKDFDIKVFAIEFNYSADLTFLEEFYSITTTPTLVVNFDNTIIGLSQKEKISKLLYEKP